MDDRYDLSDLTNLEYDIVRLCLLDSINNSLVLSDDEKNIASSIYRKMVRKELVNDSSRGL